LLQVAKSLPHVDFDVFGQAIFEQEDMAVAGMRKLANVHFRGSFDGFASIPAAPYTALLYTTSWDGVPNIILESLASGLPAIAPDVGGIREVIPPDSGFLVSDADDIDGFCASIQRLIERPNLAAAERDKQLAYVREARSESAFAQQLSLYPDYTGVPVAVRKAAG
jgi:glycosyltransferase involved in cell wall biosynthesis